jgi:hypothetical protein
MLGEGLNRLVLPKVCHISSEEFTLSISFHLFSFRRDFSNKMSPHRIYKSPFPSPAVPTDLSVSQFLLQHNPDDVPQDKTILSDFDDPKNFLTFGSLRDKASLGAGGLQAVLGLLEGDVVSVYGQNSVNWALLAHSVMWSGACFRYATL